MIVGDPLTFAIESEITQAYGGLGQRALGFFVIYVAGKRYGVHSPEATLLACSLDEVRRRIARHGEHCSVIDFEASAAKIVDAVNAAMYDENRQGETFFGVTAHDLRESLISNEIIWAPDGDAAFDDGGHVLQFDHGDKVRLIAFRNTGNADQLLLTLAEIYVDADEFYGLLDEWQGRFEAEWAVMLEQATRH